MDHIALGSPSSFTFKDYVFHLLSAAGAGAFYFGAKRFGFPRFLPTITLIINSDNPLENKDHSSVRTSASHLKLKAPDISDFDGDKINWLAWKTNSLAAFTSTGFEAILKEGADIFIHSYFGELELHSVCQTGLCYKEWICPVDC